MHAGMASALGSWERPNPRRRAERPLRRRVPRAPASVVVAGAAADASAAVAASGSSCGTRQLAAASHAHAGAERLSQAFSESGRPRRSGRAIAFRGTQTEPSIRSLRSRQPRPSHRLAGALGWECLAGRLGRIGLEPFARGRSGLVVADCAAGIATEAVAGMPAGFAGRCRLRRRRVRACCCFPIRTR